MSVSCILEYGSQDTQMTSKSIIERYHWRYVHTNRKRNSICTLVWKHAGQSGVKMLFNEVQASFI